MVRLQNIKRKYKEIMFGVSAEVINEGERI
jgi:hypothetical protein